MSETRVKVWDGWVRLVHWLIVILIPVSYFTARAGQMEWHMRSGFVLLTLVIFRVCWGLVGSHTARFSRFLRSPFAALAHLRHMRRGPDLEIGHNAAGGWMAVLMLALLATQAVTGLFTDDQIFTQGPLAKRASPEVSDWASYLHLRTINILLAAIALHVLAIVWYRIRLGHNLIGPMVTGHKALPGDTAAPRLGHPVLALVLLAASGMLVGWIWSLGT
ncbi:MAG: hydrogenase [Rubritepida sp.]|nr:hydrogenase [Rubritepida sp.]